MSADSKAKQTLATSSIKLDDQDWEEELTSFVKDQWQKIIGAVLVVVMGVWSYGEYTTATQKRLTQASEHFSEIQAHFSKVGSEEGNSEDGKKAFSETSNLLNKNFSDSFYGKAMGLYTASNALAVGDTAAARSAIEGYNIGRFNTSQTTTAPLSEAELLDELAALLQVRIHLSSQNPAEAFSLAEKIARNGRFSNVEAAVIMATIGVDENHSQALNKVVEIIRERHPHHNEALDRELNALGIRIEQKS